LNNTALKGSAGRAQFDTIAAQAIPENTFNNFMFLLHEYHEPFFPLLDYAFCQRYALRSNLLPGLTEKNHKLVIIWPHDH
jgi:hypothetical protein